MHPYEQEGLPMTLSKARSAVRAFADRIVPSTTLLTCGIAAGALAIAAAPASANVSHALTATFGSAISTPVDPYPLSGPRDVEVDQTSHDIYVADAGNHRVEKFDSAGNFLLMFGKEVNKTAVENSRTSEANLCPAPGHPADVCQPGVSASSGGAFETPAYLAVDNSGGTSSGDIYVGDVGDSIVSKFDSSGHLVVSWGPGGQKDGSDSDNVGFTSPSGGPLWGVAVSGSNGNLWVGGHPISYTYNLYQYTPDGTYIPPFGFSSGEPWLKVDLEGNRYQGRNGTLIKHGPEREGPDPSQLGTATPLTGFNLDPSTGEVYQDTGSAIAHYASGCPTEAGPCDPLDSFGSGDLHGSMGVAVDGETHTVYVANSSSGDVAVLSDIRPIVTTDPQAGATESEVTLAGHIDPAHRGDITECYFEYGFDTNYGHTVPCSPDPASSNFTEPTNVIGTVTGLSPGTEDHYRLVAGNVGGAVSVGADEVFSSTQPPVIDGLAAENLTATSADIEAQVNPGGLDTTYRVEYGTTTQYGQAAPVPDGTIFASSADQGLTVHLEGLTRGAVYHYRLVATNADGTSTVADHTFNFYPPACPNSNVRQQTQSNYVPDCRAYELVSPGDAGGTQLYPGGPNTGFATSPSRFSFTGLWGTIPRSGGSPSNSTGDLYVATRTATGWVSRYVGLPGNEFATSGEPPQGLPNSTDGGSYQYAGLGYAGAVNADKIQNAVLTDPAMSRFLIWNDDTGDASAAPYVYGADGGLSDRWPTNLGTVPAGTYPEALNLYSYAPDFSESEKLSVAPGGIHSLDCPAIAEGARLLPRACAGDVTASSDLRHFAFATEWNVFAPGGQLSAPGSVYDNDTRARSVQIASKTPAGGDIPSEPGDQAGDPLQIPAISADGSHILMAAGGTGPCGYSSCKSPPCGAAFDILDRCPMQPSHLYMRVDGAVTYDVSKGHDVHYVGETEDGSKVYFTTSQQLLPADTDTSTDLYMWSEATDSLTLVSLGVGGAGNSDACNSSFTSKCGVTTYSNVELCQLASGLGGNCRSDNSIAAKSGDIYFFSPEQLVGTRGRPNLENVYVFRGGSVRYVTTLTPGGYCLVNFEERCSAGPVARMQVSPDGSHMAFLTASQVTLYDNAGHAEMYTYEPERGMIVCVSCIPSGAAPTSEVAASQNGLFMTDDGRTFFTTDDPLVHADTNQSQDVYEYVDGHAQLITPGTGDTRSPVHNEFSTQPNLPGLLGVSANGTDVYFSTNQTLVSQDHNGLFLKFYDARSGGGFLAPAPSPPCAAADECHGAGSSTPAALQNGAGAALGGGGNAAVARHGHRKHHKRGAKGGKPGHRRHNAAKSQGGPR
jgi:hypothetical protein